MTTKTDFLLEAYKIIEALPQSFLGLGKGKIPTTGSGPLPKVARVLGFLQEWALDQGRHTYELYLTSRVVPALIMTKAIVERSAVAFSLMEQLWKAKSEGNLGDLGNLEETIATILRSCRGLNTGTAASDNSLLFLRVNLKFREFQTDYDQLCRVVDPLLEIWKTGEEGLHGAGSDRPGSVIGLKNFVSGLAVFHLGFTQCSLYLPALIRMQTHPGGS